MTDPLQLAADTVKATNDVHPKTSSRDEMVARAALHEVRTLGQQGPGGGGRLRLAHHPDRSEAFANINEGR